MIEALRRPSAWLVRAQLDTARAWGVPLSTIRRGHPPTDWSRSSDRWAAVALTMLEQSTHSPCGQPMHSAFSDEHATSWGVDDDTTCYACAALARWHKDNPEAGPDALPVVHQVAPLTDEQRAIRDQVTAAWMSARATDDVIDE